jgi:hypothetical protein
LLAVPHEPFYEGTAEDPPKDEDLDYETIND